MKRQKQEIPFIKYHPCLAHLFTPEESRFLLHMLEADFLKSCGYATDWSRAQYSKRMGLSKYSFDRCANKLTQMKLITKTHNKLGNRVYYQLNHTLYQKLIHMLSVTNNINKLIEFCDLHFRKNNRSIDSITPEEIKNLHSENDLKKKHPAKIRKTQSITLEENNLTEDKETEEQLTLSQILPLCQQILSAVKPLEELLTNPQSENQ